MTPIHSGGPDPDDLDEVCLRGELTVIGRIRSASNATFLCEAHLGELQAHCVYKPIAGEAPLWDFPDGTLAGRELGAYLVSDALGWNIVPYTIIRDGPAGRGMLQLWVDQPGSSLGRSATSPRPVRTSSTCCPRGTSRPVICRCCRPTTTPAMRSPWCTPTTSGCAGWPSSTC